MPGKNGYRLFHVQVVHRSFLFGGRLLHLASIYITILPHHELLHPRSLYPTVDIRFWSLFLIIIPFARYNISSNDPLRFLRRPIIRHVSLALTLPCTFQSRLVNSQPGISNLSKRHFLAEQRYLYTDLDRVQWGILGNGQSQKRRSTTEQRLLLFEVEEQQRSLTLAAIPDGEVGE